MERLLHTYVQDMYGYSTRRVRVFVPADMQSTPTYPPHGQTFSTIQMPLSARPRIASIIRNTKETKIQLTLSLDGGPLDFLEENPHFLDYESMPNQNSETHASQITASQHIWIWTGIGFLDHMLHAWAKHAGWSLRLRSRGDLMSLSSSSVQLFLPFQKKNKNKKRKKEKKRRSCQHFNTDMFVKVIWNLFLFAGRI